MGNNSKKNPIKYNEVFGKYCKYIWKYKWIFFILIFSVIIMQIANIIPRFLFKSLIDNGSLFISQELSKETFSGVLLNLLIVFVITNIILILFAYIRAHFLNKLEVNLVFDLKNKFFNHILSLDHDFHTTNKSGSLISRIGRGAGGIENFTDVIIFNFIPFFVQIFITGASLIYFNLLSGIVIGIISFSFIFYSIKIQKLEQKDKVIFNKSDNLEKGNIADIFTNIDSIKYFGKDEFIKQKYKKLSSDTKKKQYKYYSWFQLFDSGQNFILFVGTIAILYFPIIDFMKGNLTIGTLSFIYTTYISFLNGLYGLVWGIRGFYRSLTDLQDLFDYEKFSKTIVDKKNAPKLNVTYGNIEFKNINFKYDKNNNLFKNFNLKIPAKKTVAIIGKSGCGKSSLLKLLYRLYNLDFGNVLIDGQDISDVTQESLRNEMSIVPQEAILFDDTIYNNIKFARPSANKKEIENAIKSAQLEEFIKNLPKGYNTIVGERGVKLSGGQKQRVSIARAILADKKILVLDEATSALDSETEHEIQKDLFDLMKNRTSIVIAHRLSTIMNADLIVVMEKGKIIQMGNHRELITKGGEYARLWNFQKGGFLQD